MCANMSETVIIILLLVLTWWIWIPGLIYISGLMAVFISTIIISIIHLIYIPVEWLKKYFNKKC